MIVSLERYPTLITRGLNFIGSYSLIFVFEAKTKISEKGVPKNVGSRFHGTGLLPS